MIRIVTLVAGVLAAAILSASLASVGSAAGGNPCGQVEATDKAGDTARFSVKTYATGCNRADKGVKRYYRQTNGERGTQKKIKNYTCGPLQPYKAGKFAFQCRSNKGAAKRYKAFWVSKS